MVPLIIAIKTDKRGPILIAQQQIWGEMVVDFIPTTTAFAKVIAEISWQMREQKLTDKTQLTNGQIPYQPQQEAQLPLRNRASAMHFFVAKLLSISVITYNCVLSPF